MKSKSSQRPDSSGSLLDTHVAVWLSAGSSHLKKGSLNYLESEFNARKLFVSPISAWEVGMLVSRGRLDVGQDVLSWFNGFLEKFSVTLLDITPEIAVNSSFLPGVFHGDPADRILVATAMSNSKTLVTADQKIVDYRYVECFHV